MKYLNQILKQVDVLEQVGEDQSISSIEIDSRRVQQGSLFVALRGTQVDGHNYIGSALEKGAVAVVCEEIPEGIADNVSIVKVAKSEEVLGMLVSEFYDNPSETLKVVGVTGTNGKTTVATLLYQLFTSLGYKVGLLSTIENRIANQVVQSTHTTPDAIAIGKLMKEMVDAGCEYCFMEVSSHAIHQRRIKGIDFDGGIFTNLTHDHLDYHNTFKEYLTAKKVFFDELPSYAFALTNVDDKNGGVMLQNTDASKKSYSLRALADFNAKVLESHFDGVLVEVDGTEVWSQFAGLYNVYNLLSVYATAVLLGQPKDEVLQHISRLQTVAGRFETIKSGAGRFAIVDYAHTPDALKNVLEGIAELRTGNETLFTVVGAGGDRDKTKRPEMAAIAAEYSDRLILTSDNPRSEDPEDIINDMLQGVEAHLKNRVVSIVNRREAIRTACMMANPGDIILIAGKGHETYQEVKGVRHHFDDREIVREEFING
ncbi:UDP-N-acetylmuramoyl-L-alanyl-D-glutamate--2,6-diaminopimelate ligase [Puteibacter caeruleilacunae]|nr:UDP-N-acetylmuramoyl-L-alanyl-D-glutamate--2,6-diaminopimelate ligase [Puteibacter caeruleilacunae]